MSKIETIKWKDVGPGRYWMYDTDPAFIHEEPACVTVVEENGCTYLYGDNSCLENSYIVHIDDVVNTMVFVPIIAPRFSELQL